jgi:hypothetical protein
MGGMPGMGGMPQGPQPGAPQTGTQPSPPLQPAVQATATPSANSTATPTPKPTPTYTTLYKAVKATELVCQKGSVKKKVIATTCPTGYKKISSKSVTTFVETKVLVNP